MNAPASRDFYDFQYSNGYAAGGADVEVFEILRRFVSESDLPGALVLEVGCGRGAYRSLARRWVGVDLSVVAAREAGQRALACRAEALPFPDASFDAVWSVQTLEHLDDPEAALLEISRILKPGGVACLAPAWHCRPWTRDGVEVRMWRDLDWKLRLVKATRPFREARLLRGAELLLARLTRELRSNLRPRVPTTLRVRRLNPNYERFWQADSDATVALDQHELIMWFRSRGWRVLNCESMRDRVLFRAAAIFVQRDR